MRRERLLNKVAVKVLTMEEAGLLRKGFDVVGDIIILRFPKAVERRRFEFADALLREVSPRIKVILGQTGSIQGEYRLRDLEWLAGEKRTTTTYKENGCRLLVDLSKVYFSPRLMYERMRVAKLVQHSRDNVVVNMFAGVGSFSVVIATQCAHVKVYSIDLNPEAVILMRQNVQINKVKDQVIPILGDSKTVVEQELQHIANRILMPLPEKACEYLDVAVSALNFGTGFIHYYDTTYAKGEDPTSIIVQKVDERMKAIKADYEVALARIVRTVGPNWYQVALDLKVSL